MRRISFVTFTLLATGVLMAHPHFRKTLTVELPGGVEATVTYQTTIANPSRAQDAQIGTLLVPRGPRLQLSGDISSGSTTIPAGEYTIGVIKNGEKDWTMALYPGRLGRRDTPDMSKVIKLDSIFSDSKGTAEHMVIDINAGFDKFEGQPVLTIHFGGLFLAGALG